MSKRFPLHPAHPERICWGCDRYCPAHELACGNGAERVQHPQELFGEDWDSFGGWCQEPSPSLEKPTPSPDSAPGKSQNTIARPR